MQNGILFMYSVNYTFCFGDMLSNFVTPPTSLPKCDWLLLFISSLNFSFWGGSFNLCHLTFLKDSSSMITTLWYMNFFYLFHFLTLWFYILYFLKAEIKGSQLLLPSDWFYLKFAFQKVTSYWFYAEIIAFSIQQGCLCCLFDIKWIRVALLKL